MTSHMKIVMFIGVQKVVLLRPIAQTEANNVLHIVLDYQSIRHNPAKISPY